MEEQIKKQYSFLSDEISEARMYRQRNTTDKMTLYYYIHMIMSVLYYYI